jgi:hypothetical protein
VGEGGGRGGGGGGQFPTAGLRKASKQTSNISLIAKNFYAVNIPITHTHKRPERAFCGSSRLEISFFFLTTISITKEQL